jgi:hypothetical protein
MNFANLHFRFPQPTIWTGRARLAPPNSWSSADQEAFDRDALLAERLISNALEEVESEGILEGLRNSHSRAGVSREATQPVAARTPFVHGSRIAALREKVSSSKYDLQRLIRLCEELNICYEHECFLAVAALTRALIDHVPPLLGAQTFAEVANNYAGGKSFKESMAHLDSSARKISDSHMHQRIRERESLPTQTQIDFSRDLDVLLAEIIRVL